MSREDDGATLLHMDELREEADQAASESVGVEMTEMRSNPNETKFSTASFMDDDDVPPDEEVNCRHSSQQRDEACFATQESIRAKAQYQADRVKKMGCYDINDTAKAQRLLKNQALLGGTPPQKPCPFAAAPKAVLFARHAASNCRWTLLHLRSMAGQGRPVCHRAAPLRTPWRPVEISTSTTRSVNRSCLGCASCTIC